MSKAGFVATLIAPRDTHLSDQDIAGFSARFEKLTRTQRIDARAADVFFDDYEKMDPRRSLPHTPIRGGDDGYDVLIQPVTTRRKKILIADMESTIIEQEMLDELAARIGIGAKVADITRRAMNGEIDFALALKERVALLKGQPESLLAEEAAKMTLMPGAQELVTAMKRSGAKGWLVSGGFSYFVKIIAEQLGFDEFYANDLKLEGGKIIGTVAEPILDKNAKKNLLEKACAIYGCHVSETLAVGDGSNDMEMLRACGQGGGLGVAFHGKPKLRELIPSQINHSDLSALIYAQGLAL